MDEIDRVQCPGGCGCVLQLEVDGPPRELSEVAADEWKPVGEHTRTRCAGIAILHRETSQRLPEVQVSLAVPGPSTVMVRALRLTDLRQCEAAVASTAVNSGDERLVALLALHTADALRYELGLLAGFGEPWHGLEVVRAGRDTSERHSIP